MVRESYLAHAARPHGVFDRAHNEPSTIRRPLHRHAAPGPRGARPARLQKANYPGGQCLACRSARSERRRRRPSTRTRRRARLVMAARRSGERQVRQQRTRSSAVGRVHDQHLRGWAQTLPEDAAAGH